MQWLLSKGLPAGLGWALFWIVKLAVLGVLLYVAFWLALLFVFVVAAAEAGAARNSDDLWDDEEPEWRNGWDGYGLYRGGVRIIDGGGSDDQ